MPTPSGFIFPDAAMAALVVAQVVGAVPTVLLDVSKAQVAQSVVIRLAVDVVNHQQSRISPRCHEVDDTVGSVGFSVQLDETITTWAQVSSDLASLEAVVSLTPDQDAVVSIQIKLGPQQINVRHWECIFVTHSVTPVFPATHVSDEVIVAASVAALRTIKEYN